MTERLVPLKTYAQEVYLALAEEIDSLWHAAYPPSMGWKRPRREHFNSTQARKGETTEWWTELDFVEARRYLRNKLGLKETRRVMANQQELGL